MREIAMNWINGGISVGGYGINHAYQPVINFIESWNSRYGVGYINKFKWNAAASAQGYRVYRRSMNADDPKFYLIATTNSATTVYEDNIENPYVEPAQTPVESENSFLDPERYPGVCEFFQQRLILGRTKEKPNTIFGSHTGIYTNFDINSSDPSAGYEFQMSSRQLNAIKDIVSLDPFSLLTSGGDFVSTISGAIHAGNVNFNQHSYNGTSDIQALIIGDSAIYAPLSKQTIQSMTYSYEKAGFKRENILFHAQQYTEGKTISGMAFLRDPINLIWICLSDGTLLSCLYIPDQQFNAWSEHKTQGNVLFVNSMQTTEGYDRLWAVTRRWSPDGTHQQSIEVMDDIRPYGNMPTAENSFYVDFGISAYLDEPKQTIYGLDHLEGMDVAVLADFDVQTPKTVKDGQITLDYPAQYVHIGLPYDFVLETLNLELFNQGTLRNAARSSWQAVVELENCRELEYSTNDGKYWPLLIQKGTEAGLELEPYTGDRQINPIPRDSRSSFYRFRSQSPVPVGILNIVAEIAYATP